MNEKILESVELQLQNELDEKVAKVRRDAVVQIPEDFDGRCVECEDVIPHGRLRTGAVTCIECQRLLEASSKQRKRMRATLTEE